MIYVGIRILVVIGFNGCFIYVPWRLKLCYGYKIFLLTLLLLVGLDKRDFMTVFYISLWVLYISLWAFCISLWAFLYITMGGFYYCGFIYINVGIFIYHSEFIHYCGHFVLL